MLAPALQAALVKSFPGLELRPETPADVDFLIALYTSTRWQELAPVEWPDAAKQDFLAQQCQLQHAHYLQHYVGAELLVLRADHSALSQFGLAAQVAPSAACGTELKPIGRLYCRRGASEIRLMEIALLPQFCGRGIGGVLIQALQAEASAAALALNLHVEPTNPAQRLYRRLGFHRLEQRGVYDFLSWP